MSRSLQWKGFALQLDRRTHVMGVLNVTPDSFSDGGKHFDRDQAVAGGMAMAEQGADILDVGGESTRPFSPRLSVEAELERVIPVIESLSKQVSIPISIDTYKARVAQEALAAGAAMINDISALRFDPEMASLAAREGVPVVLMHMKGTPENMQKNPVYKDVLGEIAAFLAAAVKRATAEGIAEELILVDPGIGFGKTFDHNLQIIRDLDRLHDLGRPLLFGSSNKAFIGRILDKGTRERDTGTMATVAAAALKGAQVVRVHNVAAAVETVRIIDAVKRGRISEDEGGDL